MHIPDNFLSTPIRATLDAIAVPAIAAVSRQAQTLTDDRRALEASSGMVAGKAEYMSPGWKLMNETAPNSGGGSESYFRIRMSSCSCLRF
jgi:hypothetical protein